MPCFAYSRLVYRALDPITMLKAKAANVRDIKQDDVPPRHDRPHLRLIARCVPPYLSDIHAEAVGNPSTERDAVDVISRAFKILQNLKNAGTLIQEGIAPRSLIPDEFAQSPLARVRTAMEFQYRLLSGEANTSAPVERPIAPQAQVNPPSRRPGPRLGS